MKKNRAKSYGRNATIETFATAESQESFMRIPPPLVVLLAISQTQDMAMMLSASSSRGPVAMSADPADMVRCEATCGGH